MSVTARKKAIRSRFKTLIDDDDATLNVAYDNLEDPHEDDDLIWARMTILDGEAQVVEVGTPGNNRTRTPGTMIAQIFRQINKGEKEIDLLAL